MESPWASKLKWSIFSNKDCGSSLLFGWRRERKVTKEQTYSSLGREMKRAWWCGEQAKTGKGRPRWFLKSCLEVRHHLPSHWSEPTLSCSLIGQAGSSLFELLLEMRVRLMQPNTVEVTPSALASYNSWKKLTLLIKSKNWSLLEEAVSPIPVLLLNTIPTQLFASFLE